MEIHKQNVTDVYFLKTKKILETREADYTNHQVTYNLFIRSKTPFVVSGISWAKKILTNRGAVVSYSLRDGQKVEEGCKSLLVYSGKITDLIDLETTLLGGISDASTSATAMREIVDVANNKPIIYMGARHRSPGADFFWSMGALDGGATYITAEPTSFSLGSTAIGTMPHAYILACGSTLQAAISWEDVYYGSDNLSVLIDTFGKELTDTKVLLSKFRCRLKSVRIDTSGERLCQGCDNTLHPTRFLTGPGVTVEAVSLLRKTLDTFEYISPESKALDWKGNKIEYTEQDIFPGRAVKIIASSGFTAEKVAVFEGHKAPVDVYGVGLGEVKNYLFATADIVYPNHKAGRYEDCYDQYGNFIPIK